MVSIFTALLLINNLNSMFNYQDSNISTSIKDSHLSYNDTFTQKDGLLFAIAIPEYDRLLADKIVLTATIVDWDSG